MNAAAKIFSLIALAVAIFLTGCETVSTVKHDPVSASEVYWIESKNGFIETVRISNGLNPDYPKGAPFTIRSSIEPLLKKCQYIGQVRWSGFLPELNIPESAYGTDMNGALAFVPDRVKEVFRERAGEMGANLVVLELGIANCHWAVQDGKFQPIFLLYGKAYFKPGFPAFPRN